jgi:hypothetical protein
MGAVADKLGVRMTVLYGYVRGREDLLRLASARTSQQFELPADTGQHWSIYIAAHAAALFALFTGPGQLLSQFASGGLGPEVEIDRAEMWLVALTSRGFTAADALLLQQQMGEIVMGGAMTAMHARSLEASGRGFETAARKAVRARKEEDNPLIRSVEDLFARRRPAWRLTLVQLLQSVARERKEHLDLEQVLEVLEHAESAV